MREKTKPTPMKAIENMCKQCIYDPCQKGTWREQTEGCTSPLCALFELRPLTIATINRKKEVKLAGLSEKERALVLAKRREAAKHLWAN